MNDVLLSPIKLNELEVLIQNSVERALKGKQLAPDRNVPKNFGIDGLLDLLEEETGKRPAKQTIYGLVYRREIPFDKPSGTKQLRFNRDEVMEWLNGGRQVSHLKQG